MRKQALVQVEDRLVLLGARCDSRNVLEGFSGNVNGISENSSSFVLSDTAYLVLIGNSCVSAGIEDCFVTMVILTSSTWGIDDRRSQCVGLGVRE